jgi:hypothetical protein
MFYIISLLYNLDISTISVPCQQVAGYALAPLPASKSLWRAQTEQEWEAEWTRGSTFHGVLKNGDLVNLHRDFSVSAEKRTAWEQWWASADEMGFLVALAANIQR